MCGLPASGWGGGPNSNKSTSIRLFTDFAKTLCVIIKIWNWNTVRRVFVILYNMVIALIVHKIKIGNLRSCSGTEPRRNQVLLSSRQLDRLLGSARPSRVGQSLGLVHGLAHRVSTSDKTELTGTWQGYLKLYHNSQQLPLGRYRALISGWFNRYGVSAVSFTGSQDWGLSCAQGHIEIDLVASPRTWCSQQPSLWHTVVPNHDIHKLQDDR